MSRWVFRDGPPEMTGVSWDPLDTYRDVLGPPEMTGVSWNPLDIYRDVLGPPGHLLNVQEVVTHFI